MSGFSLGHWLVVGFVVWVVYRVLRSRVPRPAPGRQADGSVEVVGESFYRTHFERLFPRHGSGDDHEASATATLVLEDGNPHDDQAVAVFIRGLQVGHLSRDDARRFRRSKGRDRRDTLASAVVWVPGDPDYHYSVTLTLRI